MFLRKVYILPFILFSFYVIPLTWGHTEQIKKNKILLYNLKPKEYQILFNLIWLYLLTILVKFKHLFHILQNGATRLWK